MVRLLSALERSFPQSIQSVIPPCQGLESTRPRCLTGLVLDTTALSDAAVPLTYSILATTSTRYCYLYFVREETEAQRHEGPAGGHLGSVTAKAKARQPGSRVGLFPNHAAAWRTRGHVKHSSRSPCGCWLTQAFLLLWPDPLESSGCLGLSAEPAA